MVSHVLDGRRRLRQDFPQFSPGEREQAVQQAFFAAGNPVPAHWQRGWSAWGAVAQALLAVAPAHVALRPGPRRPHADLRAVNEALLRAAGVREIEQVGPCTRCSPDHFSHRREGEATGRLAAVIGLRERRV